MPAIIQANIQQLLDEAYLNLGDTSNRKINDVIISANESFIENPYLDILDICRKPENFWFTCKHFLNLDLHPFQILVLQELWKRKFPMFIASRGTSKSFTLAVYCLLRALFHQGCKIVIVGGAFRQAKVIFDYMDTIYSKSPILRNILGDGARQQGPKREIDRCSFNIGDSHIIIIPLGSGDKIRGLRANYTITDEFSSVPKEIFETVVRGFGAVMTNPVENVKKMAGINLLKEMNMYTDEMQEIDDSLGNQTVLAGTAYYAFNHFYEYWTKYKKIIQSAGDINILQEYFQGIVPKNFLWSDYSIIRLPYNYLPEGFLDDVMIAQSRAISNSTTHLMEYGTIFATDSNGFYKRSAIEKCVCNQNITTIDGEVSPFEGMTFGDPNKKYIFGIDPASETDNFAIVILEIYPGHRRVVYSWTVTRQKLRERLSNTGKENVEQSFYNYCARKIRDLIKVFPTSHIGIDSQGGGIGIIEALHDSSQYEDGDFAIWPYTRYADSDTFWWEEKNKPTDNALGQHILHSISFSDGKWIAEANHGLRQDIETKILLFPQFDSASIGLAIENDKIIGREYDTLEDVVMEIEELKDELATIQHSQTANGRDRWDTPDTKVGIMAKKGRLRKDRYSALLIANMIARCLSNASTEKQPYYSNGTFVGKSRSKAENNENLYIGPQHIISKITYTGGLGLSH